MNIDTKLSAIINNSNNITDPYSSGDASGDVDIDQDDSQFPFDSSKKDRNRKRTPRRTYSCGLCRRMKIKCDNKIPCSSCIKHHRVKQCLEDPAHPRSPKHMTSPNHHNHQRFAMNSYEYDNEFLKRRRRNDMDLNGNPTLFHYPVNMNQHHTNNHNITDICVPQIQQQQQQPAPTNSGYDHELYPNKPQYTYNPSTNNQGYYSQIPQQIHNINQVAEISNHGPNPIVPPPVELRNQNHHLNISNQIPSRVSEQVVNLIEPRGDLTESTINPNSHPTQNTPQNAINNIPTSNLNVYSQIPQKLHRQVQLQVQQPIKKTNTIQEQINFQGYQIIPRHHTHQQVKRLPADIKPIVPLNDPRQNISTELSVIKSPIAKTEPEENETLTEEETISKLNRQIEQLQQELALIKYSPQDIYNRVDSVSTLKLNISQLLPSKKKCRIILDVYFNQVDYIYRTIHVPLFYKEVESFEKLDNFNDMDLPWISLLLMVLTVGCVHLPQSLARKIDAGNSMEDCSRNITLLCEAWFHASREALRASKSDENPKLIQLQTFSQTQMYLSVTRRPELLTSYLAQSISHAFALGLHKIDVHNKGNQIERELKRRLWWDLCGCDTFRALSFGRPPMIRSYTSKVPLPGNLDDLDITETSNAVPKPMDIPTDNSIDVIRARIMQILNGVYELTHELRQDRSDNNSNLSEQEDDDGKSPRSLTNSNLRKQKKDKLHVLKGLVKTDKELCDYVNKLPWYMKSDEKGELPDLSIYKNPSKTPEEIEHFKKKFRFMHHMIHSCICLHRFRIYQLYLEGQIPMAWDVCISSAISMFQVYKKLKKIYDVKTDHMFMASVHQTFYCGVIQSMLLVSQQGLPQRDIDFLINDTNMLLKDLTNFSSDVFTIKLPILDQGLSTMRKLRNLYMIRGSEFQKKKIKKEEGAKNNATANSTANNNGNNNISSDRKDSIVAANERADEQQLVSAVYSVLGGKEITETYLKRCKVDFLVNDDDDDNSLIAMSSPLKAGTSSTAPAVANSTTGISYATSSTAGDDFEDDVISVVNSGDSDITPPHAYDLIPQVAMVPSTEKVEESFKRWQEVQGSMSLKSGITNVLNGGIPINTTGVNNNDNDNNNNDNNDNSLTQSQSNSEGNGSLLKNVSRFDQNININMAPPPFSRLSSTGLFPLFNSSMSGAIPTNSTQSPINYNGNNNPNLNNSMMYMSVDGGVPNNGSMGMAGYAQGQNKGVNGQSDPDGFYGDELNDLVSEYAGYSLGYY